jgi:para-nitrobenzyl esterase
MPAQENVMSLTAETELGGLRGAPHNGVVQFRGVPYARPPLGELRFRPPVPQEPWPGRLDATAHGPIAPQGPSRLRVAVGDFARPQSEDCLTLTITTPAPDGERRPVIVWLHGGGYGTGAGSLDWYDGASLARDGDVVVVGVNYRLGPLGYLSGTGLGDRLGDGLGDGQMGLRDMIAAIRWVSAHIGSFGGDPGEITVMGQSAGAHSALFMLAGPDVRRLFRRVILQSAPAGVAPFSTALAAGWTERYLGVLGLSGLAAARAAQRLRSAEPAALLRAASTLARDTAHLGQVEPPFLPVVDELADPAAFLEAAARGAAEAGVRIIVGTNRDEARAIVAGDQRAEGASSAQVEAYLDAVLDDGRARRYRQRLAAARPVDVLAEAMTDVAFTRPSLQFAALAAEAGAEVWAYQLDWAPAGSPFGACHCLELPLIFGNDGAWSGAPMLGGADPARNRVARQMRAAWLSFARHGHPGPGVLPWPTYDRRQRRTMVFGASPGVTCDPAGLAGS